MNILKKLMIAIITSFMMISGILIPIQAKGTGVRGTPVQSENEGEGLPDYTDGYEMHGFSDDNAEEIDSMFSDDIWAKFNEDMDDLLGFEPVSDADAAALFSGIEQFRVSGGVSEYLKNGNLSAGASIGLTENSLDKVHILGEDTNASDWIYVVDKDATCIVVLDEDGQGIPDAQVTISYTDDKNTRVTRSVFTSSGNKRGIAAFSELPDTFNCILDIQADGYHAVSVLDKTLTAGDTFPFVLSDAADNELYLRGADLEGKDLAFEETDLYLMNMDTEDENLRIIVSKTGDVSLPSYVDLYSETRGKVILTLDQSSGYEYDSQSRVYTAKKRWIEQNKGLFEDGDIVSVRLPGNPTRLEHLTIENARETPRIGETTMPLTASPMETSITDRMGGAGWLNFTAQILQVPVTFGVFPDGTFILMASYDITNLDPNTQYKYSSLFDKSWKPKAFANSKNILESFQKSFWQNAEKVHSGKTKLNSKDKVWLLTNKVYDIGMSFSVFLKLNYSEETDDHYGTGGFVFNLNFMGGLTEYFVFFAGPVAIPVYIGFEFSLGVKIALSVNLFTDTPPSSEARDKKWKYTSSDGWDLNDRIDAIGNLDVFGGVGVKGVLGANANGYFTVDVAAVLGKGPANIFTADPHQLVDLFWGLKINYYLLFFSGQIKLECVNKAKRVWDSWGEHDLSQENTQLVFKDLSLESCADELIPLNENADTDPAFSIANNDAVLTASNLKNVDAYTYPDNQAQFVASKNHTALFRIVADGAQTHLVYQFQDPETGDIDPTVYQVKMPGNKSVTDYVAVPNKGQDYADHYGDYVYIGAVLADNTVPDMNERAKTSEVAAVIVDLSRRKTVSSEIASDPANNGRYLYSAPRPAGLLDVCNVCYAATRIEECENAEDLLETIAAGLRDIRLTNTTNHISYCDINDREERQHWTMGEKGTVFSTGYSSPLEPVYWIIDPIRSTDKTLVIKGYDADGSCPEDLKHYAQIDISKLKITDFNYEPVLTNWQYINGHNYFIAGDTVYWMRKSSEEIDNYTWITEPVENGSGMINTEGRYTMVTNNNQSAIYIIGVVDSYDIDVENWTETKSSNHLIMHTLLTEGPWGKPVGELHGPLELGFAKGDRITNFTAAYNPKNCESKGMSIVYSSPIEANRSVYSPINAQKDEEEPGTDKDAEAAAEVSTVSEEVTDDDDDDFDPAYDTAAEAASIRLWKQDAERGMRVTEVKIPDYVFRNNQPYVVVNVTYRNYGYAKEGPVMFSAKDEQGNKLVISDGTDDMTEKDYFYPENLYTGDSVTAPVYIRPHSSWEANSEHEIIVEVLPEYYYDGGMEDIINSVHMESDSMTLTANNLLIGDKHYVSLQITNNTFVSKKTPKIKAIFRYADPKKEQTERIYSLPTQEDLLRYDGNDAIPAEQIYNIDLNMDQIWKDGLKEGLQGIYFSLVDDDGVQQSNEIVYVLNPEETIGSTVSGTKVDENGDALASAAIGLFAEGSDEPVQTAVSDENGVFVFANIGEGNYTVKETEAPEGYVLDQTEYPVKAQVDGEIFEVKLVNRRIRGNVLVNLTGTDQKKLPGAEIAVYAGDKLIGTLMDQGNGTYTFDGLLYGEYTLRPVKLPDGYQVSDTYTVKITEDGVTVIVNMTAAKGEAAAPDTRDKNSIAPYAGLLTASLAVIILILAKRRTLKQTK